LLACLSESSWSVGKRSASFSKRGIKDIYTWYTLEEGNEAHNTIGIPMEDGDALDGVLHVREQLGSAIRDIEPTTYQCDFLDVRASLDYRSRPGMYGEGADAGKVDRCESVFDSCGIFTAETIYNLECI
jgi:hypothetical protein